MIERIRKTLNKLDENKSYEKNIKILKKEFIDLNKRYEDNQTLLHILTDNKFVEFKCLFAIKCLLRAGIDPNIKEEYGYNFIQDALYIGYSENFILSIMNEALDFGLNVNHVDDDKDTILHTAIYSDDYKGGVLSIYKLLIKYGFDSTLKDKDGLTVYDAIVSEGKHSILEFKDIFLEQTKGLIKNVDVEYSNERVENTEKVKEYVEEEHVQVEKTSEILSKIDKKDLEILEKFGEILNLKNYYISPTVNREKEVLLLIKGLLQEKTRPLIVGKSGVGKTTLVHELAYRIQRGLVPNFLKNKIVVDINPNDVVAGCNYSGDLERNMSELIRVCLKYNIILLIDEIHEIYGIGTTQQKKTGMEAMFKRYIDRSELKVIGTTTEEEYNEYFSSDALKRRFKLIKVLEPEEKDLYKIIERILDYYCIKKCLTFEDDSIKNSIIKIIINVTKKENRIYNDNEYNPSLSSSIIDDAVVEALFENSSILKPKHFINSIDNCYRIKCNAKGVAIKKLSNLEKIEEKPYTKVLKVDFDRR